MSEYTPDKWAIVKISPKDEPGFEPFFKILAGWYGGFSSGDSWKLSSGIENILDKGECWEMPQSSGSVYMLHKDGEGCSAYMMQSFNYLANHAMDCIIEMVEFESFKKGFNVKD